MTVPASSAAVEMRKAQEHIAKGDWSAAAHALELAAGIHAREGRSYDQARCLQLSATLRRSSGETEQARGLLERAAAVAPGDQPLHVSIAAERAETAMAAGRYEESIAAWSEAIDLAGTAGLRPNGMSALLRRRATALVADGRLPEAHGDFTKAATLLEAEHGVAMAGFVWADAANALLQHGHPEEAAVALANAEHRAPAGDPHLRAEIEVLRAKLARLAGDLTAAEGHAERARAAALEAIAPVPYFAAASELAAISDTRGDLAQAYGVLATAWGTLSDVLGREAASAWVEPVLAAYRIQWGASRFAEAKAAYEERRRAAREKTQ